MLEPKKERRAETPVYDTEVRKGIRYEKIVMTGIFLVMSWAAWNLQQMQTDIKKWAEISIANQTTIKHHTTDQRAHLPIK